MLMRTPGRERRPSIRISPSFGCQENGEPMIADPRMLAFLADNHAGVLATVKRDGRPQLSNLFYGYDADAQVVRISVTADRVKTRNVRADPRVTLHVTSPDFWTWVAVEGTAELTPVAADPHDATVDELITCYRHISGEHEDWNAYRAAMVADRRLVLRIRPEHAYGRLSG
jgi:PPOX class probable F420-dependent enzyme